MKILIANDIDESLWLRRDPRAWAQRIFWFAEEGDLVILSDAPDPHFVRHVGELSGVDSREVRVRVCPAGRHGNRRIDWDGLLNPDFLAELNADLGEITEVFSLFPSAMVSEFAARLDLPRCFPGAAFFAQGGSELANSKGTFRALAAAAGIPVAPGTVCQSAIEAIRATQGLIDSGHDVIVKKVQSAGGAGNEMVLRPMSERPGNLGARRVYYLTSSSEAIHDYWAERWDWASVDGRYSVVVELLLEVRDSFYVEIRITDYDCVLLGAGCLAYTSGKISCETLGLSNLPRLRAEQAIAAATRLASVYQAMGYRGFFCADAVLTADNEIFFTEVNARVTTGSHLHHFISLGATESAPQDNLLVRQYSSPPEWEVRSTEHFIARLGGSGILYSSVSGTGVFMVMPIVANDQRSGSFMYAISSRATDDGHYRQTLNASFPKTDIST
jgi:hypothetical protein